MILAITAKPPIRRGSKATSAGVLVVPVFEVGKTPPKVCLDLRLLKEECIGTGTVRYSTVEDYETHKDTVVHRNILAANIVGVEG